MIPLLLGSAITVGVALERLIFFLGLDGGGTAFREQLRGGISRPEQLLNELENRRGVVAATARAGLAHWSDDPEQMAAAMAASARSESKQLRRFLPLLETTVTACPLIGLLGTITGMMGVFRVVAQKLANDPHANTTGITAGIGEALIATATGILVAVVALLIHNAFQAWGEAHLDEAEQVADLLQLARRRAA
ncbi:MAG: MotA/TolQ/ExbB proton channel family protein [Vulcanimicrobiota bacterium]